MNYQYNRRKKIVLVVDNDHDLVESNATALRRQGYDVLTATSADQALSVVADRWFHLAILDTRLHNDADRADYSGIGLAWDERLRIYPRIIFTSFEPETLMELITERYGQGSIPEGVKVYRKRGPDSDITTIVERAFTSHKDGGLGQVGINFGQHLNFIDPPSTLSLVDLLQNVPRDGETIIARMNEIEDLLGKAFADCETLTITRLPQGRGNGFVLIVTPQQEGEQLAPLIVKVGDRASIRIEYQNYMDHVRRFMNRVGLLEDNPVYTLHLGLLKYRIANAGNIEETNSFAEFYRWQSQETIRQAIRHLMQETLQPWYGTGVRNKPEPLARFYEDRLLFRTRDSSVDRSQRWEQTRETIQRIIKSAPASIEVRARGDALIWSFSGHAIQGLDPFPFLSEVRHGRNLLFKNEHLVCRGHGDMHAENIRVSENARTWVIDFEYTGWGPVLQDSVELESAIHFGLIQDHQFERLFLFEQALATQPALDQPPEFPAALRGDSSMIELEKAFAVITQLRYEAEKIEGARYEDYLLGLIYQALRMTRTERAPSWADTRRPSFYKVLAVFIASVCCQRLANIGAHEPSPIIV